MFKLRLKSIQQYVSPKQWMLFWYRHYKGMFFFGFLVVLGSGGYFWYNNLYQYRWNEEQKNQFIEKHFKSTVFQEKKFHQLVDDLRDRAKRHEEIPSLSKDIFSGQSLR